MIKTLDCLFLVVSSSKKSYQKLSETYSAIEPPTWALLLAQSMRADENEVGILDANAESLTEDNIYQRIIKLNPRIICFVVYGQNVNAGTTIMRQYTLRISEEKKLQQKICFVGSRSSSSKTNLERKSIDFVLTNEGVYAKKYTKLDP